MAFKIRGHQPVVVMKRSNIRGAKGHSRANYERKEFSRSGSRCAYLTNATWCNLQKEVVATGSTIELSGTADRIRTPKVVGQDA
jgi:hypothetical protein